MVNKVKKKVILDTDLFNEADDQFALAYLLKNSDKFDLRAITISPFKHSKYDKTIEESIEDSYNEACLMYDLFGIFDKSNIYKGSINYLSNGYEEDNDAVKKIIDISSKNDLTVTKKRFRPRASARKLLKSLETIYCRL